MKEKMNRYFDFIGIENEGHKRITIIVLPFVAIYLGGTGIVGEIYRLILHLIPFGLEEGDLNYFLVEILIGLPIWIFLTIFFVGFIIRTFNWVKEGFNK